MKLKNLYTNLSFGELSNLSIGGDGSGDIPIEHRDRINNHINQALSTLFSRFVLLEKEVIIRAHEDISIYTLDKAYADSNPNATVKYIEDNPEFPFTNDVIKVLGVFDENGKVFTLDDAENPLSVILVSYNTLQIPLVGSSFYSVIYQANHPQVSSADEDQEILVPYFLEEALQSLVASKVLSVMNGEEHSRKSIEYLQLYEQRCAMIQERDLANSSTATTNIKFHNRGWI